MGKRPAPWMSESIAYHKERAAAEKAANKARGSRLYAVLPWRRDGHYDGANVIRWFRREADADKWALELGGHGGRGIAVRFWGALRNPDATPRERTPAELEREIIDAINAY